MAGAGETTATTTPRVERLRRAVKAGHVIVSSDPFELVRARRGRLAIDVRRVAGALIAAEPEFFGPGAEDV